MSAMDWDWFRTLIGSVGTPRFFQTSGPLTPEDEAALGRSELSLPRDYLDFVRTFGECRLFRRSLRFGVSVFVPRTEHEDSHKRPLLHFGRSDDSLAFFTYEPPAPTVSFIQTWTPAGFRRVNGDFSEWLIAACRRARKSFRAAEWRDIAAGPPPFTPEELGVVAARRRYEWKVLEVLPDGQVRLRIRNGSDATLKYLSLGVRVHDPSTFYGTIETMKAFPVHDVLPGQDKVIVFTPFDGRVKGPVTIFDYPDPQPEDRDYWEFRTLE